MNLTLVALVVGALAVGACGGDTTEPGGGITSTTAAGAGSPSTASTLATTTTAVDGAEAPEPAGTSWNVILYNTGTAMVNLWPDTEIWFGFGDSGLLAGFSGCNDFGAQYTLTGDYVPRSDGVRDRATEGQALELRDLSWTQRACLTPANVMDQEVEFLAAMQQVGRWFLSDEDGHLFLRDAEGSFLVEAEPPSPG